MLVMRQQLGRYEVNRVGLLQHRLSQKARGLSFAIMSLAQASAPASEGAERGGEGGGWPGLASPLKMGWKNQLPDGMMKDMTYKLQSQTQITREENVKAKQRSVRERKEAEQKAMRGQDGN